MVDIQSNTIREWLRTVPTTMQREHMELDLYNMITSMTTLRGMEVQVKINECDPENRKVKFSVFSEQQMEMSTFKINEYCYDVHIQPIDPLRFAILGVLGKSEV